MTDKQIIIYKKECYNEPHCSLNQVLEQLKAKEQECEELKEAQKNSRCAWKSLEGTFCPQAQEQLEAYKMEAEEGKEINAELKAENEELKNRVAELSLFQLYKIQRDEAEQTLTEIKEIAENVIKNVSDRCIETTPMYYIHKQILQKISEVLE